MIELKGVKFLYDKPALVVSEGRKKYLLVGDIHIGNERKLAEAGVHAHDLPHYMANEIDSLAIENHARTIVLMGDVKDSLLRPDKSEKMQLDEFFYELSKYDLKVIRGNHDSYMGSFGGVEWVDEFLTGDFAMMHGHKWPSEAAMERKVLITAHNHIAVEIKDRKGRIRNEKAWLVTAASDANIGKFYERHRAEYCVTMPAFNSFITGMPVNRGFPNRSNISPLFRNSLFDYENGRVFTLRGEFLGLVKDIES